MKALEEKHFRKVPVAELIVPKTGTFMVYADYWWKVTDDDCVLFFDLTGRKRSFGSPQCNSSKDIAQRALRDSMYPWPVHLEKIAAIYVPISPSDF